MQVADRCVTACTLPSSQAYNTLQLTPAACIADACRITYVHDMASMTSVSVCMCVFVCALQKKIDLSDQHRRSKVKVTWLSNAL